MTTHYDLLIVGGGLIGNTLALALRDTPWRIALVEAHVFPRHPQAIQDMRAIALPYASQQRLLQLGVWETVVSYATPITKVHVSEHGQFGSTLLSAEESGLPALGYVVPIGHLYQGLCQQLEVSSPHALTRYQPAVLQQLEREGEHWRARVNEQWINASLVIAADGERSFIRDHLEMPTAVTDYEQVAIVSHVKFSRSHNNIAYERFTSKGIVALLPLIDPYMAVVWTVDTHKAEQMVAMSDSEFLQFTQKAIGERRGKLLSCSQRQSYPLRETVAEQQTLPGLVLLGDSAHRLSPVAAQGFNLGLRDTWELAELLRQTTHLPNEALLQTYLQQRLPDQQQTVQFTRRLINTFAPQLQPLPMLRGLGLAVFDLLPTLKRRFAWKRIGQQ